MIDPSVLTRLPDAPRAKATEEMDARIAAALADSAKSVDVSRLLEEVEAANEAADAAAGEARALALDPRLTPDEVKLARREMEDAAFTRDRLNEARKKLAERVENLKALEKERIQRADHERVSAERAKLAEAMDRMPEPIVQIAQLVRQIDLCDRQIGRLNATSRVKLGHIPLVLSGAAPAVAACFRMSLSAMFSARSRDCSHHQLYPRGRAAEAKSPVKGPRERQKLTAPFLNSGKIEQPVNS
jgi:hypothetical protein